jgi:hypothetical protein
MFHRRSRQLSGLLLVSALVLASSAPAMGGLVYNGGTGFIAYGVSNYAGPPVGGAPTYILNGFNGRTDILASPGGGFLTVNAIGANNIASTGGVVLPASSFQSGGGNGFGGFGQGFVFNSGPSMGLSLADFGATGASASYAVASASVTYTVTGAPIAASFGASLSMSGSVPLVGSVAVQALRVHVTDSANVFGAGGMDLPQMVLAMVRTGTGSTMANYSTVMLGGTGGTNAGLKLDNGATGAFRGLATDNLALATALPVNDVLSVTYTLTGFADPASFNTFDPTNSGDLLALTGPLPINSVIDTFATPEPASLSMLVVGVLGVLGYSARRRLGRRRSE